MRMALILVAGLVAGCGKSADPINEAIRQNVDRKDGAPTEKDLAAITALYVHDRGITDLTPLAQLPNLEELWLADNRVSDLLPLAGLAKLTSLDLQNNRVTDLTPLHALKQLRNLILKDNPATAAEIARLQKALPKCAIQHNSQ